MQFLQTVLCTFLEVLMRRIYLTVRSSFNLYGDCFLSSPDLMFDTGWLCEGDLDASHS